MDAFARRHDNQVSAETRAHGAGGNGFVARPRTANRQPLPAHLARDAIRRRMLAIADAAAVTLGAVTAQLGR